MHNCVKVIALIQCRTLKDTVGTSFSTLINKTTHTYATNQTSVPNRDLLIAADIEFRGATRTDKFEM